MSDEVGVCPSCRGRGNLGAGKEVEGVRVVLRCDTCKGTGEIGPWLHVGAPPPTRTRAPVETPPLPGLEPFIRKRKKGKR